MSPHQMLSVGVRLFAVWLAIYLARSFPAQYMLARDAHDDLLRYLAVGVILLGCVVVLVLWHFPRVIARGLLPNDPSAPVQPAAVDTWFGAGCGLLGLWLISLSLPVLARDVFVIAMSAHAQQAGPRELYEELLYFIIQLIVGFWVLLGARGIRRLLSWARHGAH